MDNVIYTGVLFVLTLAGFIVGKFFAPKLPEDVAVKLGALYDWATKFVVWAKEFMKDKTGPEKMDEVIKQLQAVAKAAGWKVTEEQLRAIAQSAYNAMKAGEATQTATPLETITAAPTVVINTTEKVAVATDNVPAGAAEPNQDGTVNVYDAGGNIVGAITQEEADKMTAEITKVVDDKGEVLEELK